MSLVSSASKIISVSHASYSYDGEIDAVSDVSLDVFAGEHLCILGSNGSGKSTLARLFNGLLIPDSGTVEVCGMHTTDDTSLNAIRADCGMVFQNPSDQMVASTVEDDVAFGPNNLGLSDEEIEERVRSALSRVGLLGFEMRSTTSLSGGQQQRVAVAGALAMRSKVMIFDEATSMLDPRGREKLLKLERDLCDAGIAVVAITHFMNEAAHADRIVVLDEGRIVVEGTPDEVFRDASMLRRLALEIPFAARLSIELEKLGCDVGFHVADDELICALKRRLGNVSDLGIPNKSTLQNRSHPDGATQPAIRFEDVSYSYASKRQLKQAMRGKNEPKRARRIQKVEFAADAGEALAKKGRKWGDDPNSIWALEDVSLTIEESSITGIIGHTGSGKSTILQLANGLLRATSGAVIVAGTPIHDRRTQAEALREVGVVLQYPERQLFAQTVFDDVAFGPRNLGLSADEVKERVIKALEVMGLDENLIMQANPFRLSGGQKRRVAIAGVLAMSPKVLMLDEPATGLDPRSHESMLDLLRKLRDKAGMTVVMVSHSMDDIAMMCDKVIMLDRGSVKRIGTPFEVFSDKSDLAKAGLGLPHVMRYADALGISEHDKVLTESELAHRIACALKATSSPQGDEGCR